MSGQQLKLDGMDRVERNNALFVRNFRELALTIARANGTVTSDDLRKIADKIDVQPDHPNAWGSIFRGKFFKPVGYTQSEIPSCHGRTIRVWAAAG